MRSSGMWTVVALGLIVVGCEPAAEREAAGREDPAEAGYDPDTLSWFQEGRPITHDGRQWRPVGEAVFERRGALRHVGDYEGMALYAPVGESPPYDHLFFPYGSEIWQPLEPVPPAEAEPGMDG